MYIKHDKSSIKPALGWSGGDGVEHALERIKNLVNKCVFCGEMLLRDGEGYLSPTALKTKPEQKKVKDTVKKLTVSEPNEPPFDENGNPTPGAWFNKYDNVSRAFRNVIHVALFGNIAPGLSILDMEKDLARTFVKSLKDIRPMTYDDWIAFKKKYTYSGSRSYDYVLGTHSYDYITSTFWDNEPQDEEEEFHRITEDEYTDYLIEQNSKRIAEEVRRRRSGESKTSESIPWYKDPDQRDRSYEYNPDWWKKHVDNLPF